MTARIASAAVLAPAAIAVAWVGGIVFVLFWTIAAAGIFWEWTSLVATARRLILALGFATLAIMAALTAAGWHAAALLVLAAGVLGVGLCAQARTRLWAVAGLLYAAIALSAPTALRSDANSGFLALLFLFAVVWLTDILAYFVGRALGGPKLCPAISPKKTWAGAVGGAAGAVVVGVVFASYAELEPVPLALLGFALSVIAQAGDLFESAVKRRFGAKDASHLIPGHGGVMDRLDAFLAAALAAALIGVLRGGVETSARGLLVW
ncbi:MAG TPA: phosphatidate cytidylyltransferase [Xanthobacteraceae bacterium]